MDGIAYAGKGIFGRVQALNKARSYTLREQARHRLS